MLFVEQRLACLVRQRRQNHYLPSNPPTEALFFVDVTVVLPVQAKVAGRATRRWENVLNNPYQR